MSDPYLKTWIERVGNLEDEQKGIGSDKRDLYSEAKGKGYNPKVLRRLVRELKRDSAEQAAEDAELETYRAALGVAVELVAGGASLRKAAKTAGVSKSSVHRALAVPAVSQETAGLDTPPGLDRSMADITTVAAPGRADDLEIPGFLDRSVLRSPEAAAPRGGNTRPEPVQ